VRIIPDASQGILPFQIYASKTYKSNISSPNFNRFDWVELIDSENKEAFNGIYAHVCAICLLQCQYGYIDFYFVGAAASKKQKNDYQLLNPFPSIMYDILNRNSKSKRNVPEMEYYVRSLTLINRPAFVVPESAAASDNFRFRIQDLQNCQFTSIPYAF
jgi:hypothetical protein